MAPPAEMLAGRYRLGRLLGQGGMSDVYAAADESADRAVAIKIVRSVDPDLARRLAQEARALERVAHPGMVRLLDAGLIDGYAYLVMELVEGSTLAKALRTGSLGPERTAMLGAELADALAYVHAHGIVHRDVKPSNILVTSNGRALLSDFGIARLVDASTLTVAGTTLGTAAYMAPEQIENHQVGPSADIWSLGMVLLECLNGRRVYEGSPGEVVARRLAGPVPLPSDLPVTWKLLLSGMLDHRPDQRLDGAAVAALLATAPFRLPWDPEPSLTDGQGETMPHDLTALVSDPAGRTVLGSGNTRVAEHGPVVTRPAPRRRRWLVAALGAMVLVGLCLGLVFGLGSSPAVHGHQAGGATEASRQSTTTVPATTTTAPATTTTPTTLPSGATALSALVRDLALGEAAGSIDSGSAQSISNQAQQAISDEAAGSPDQSANDLQQIATTIASGLQNGQITQAEGVTLQSDLASLATALGLTAAGFPATDQHAGNGQGDGNKH